MVANGEPPAVDPRRALWRRGSYEIAGDWIASASRSVLEDLERLLTGGLRGTALLDVATGTGTVAIEAARRGATVVGVDLTNELVDVAVRRATAADVEIRFEIGDFDHLDNVVGGETFDVITSSFGVIFAPDPVATLRQFEARLSAEGLLGVVGWDPASVFVVPDRMLDLMPEPPRMLDMGTWTTSVEALAARAGWEVVSTRHDDLAIPFDSVRDAAEQLERWSGGWAQLLEALDALGEGDEARRRFRDHLAGYAQSTESGIVVEARHHTSVLRRSDP